VRSKWDIDGRVVLITGGAGGLALPVARDLIERGARVALLDRDLAGVEHAAERLGPMAAAWRADVRDLESVEDAIDRAYRQFGRIDVVVANAGINAFAPVQVLDPDVFERVIDVNLTGAWRTIRAALPYVIERRGYVLATSSMAAFVHAPLQAHYAASKAGMKALIDSLRVELRRSGVAVGSLHPTFFASMMMRDTLNDPAGGSLWGGNSSGAWGMTPLEKVAREAVRAIERRKKQVVVPRRLLPVALMPGVVRPFTDRLLKDKNVARAAEKASATGWKSNAAAVRIGAAEDAEQANPKGESR
jgi:NAD(P)-dependent dehydrogenase (short-subunit alcohol dehydrogenase family)